MGKLMRFRICAALLFVGRLPSATTVVENGLWLRLLPLLRISVPIFHLHFSFVALFFLLCTASTSAHFHVIIFSGRLDNGIRILIKRIHLSHKNETE